MFTFLLSLHLTYIFTKRVIHALYIMYHRVVIIFICCSYL